MNYNPYIPSEQQHQSISANQKIANVRLLSSTINGSPWIDVTSCLFGLLLTSFDLKADSRALDQIKRQFGSMKQAINNIRQLNNNDAVMIVYDLILKIEKQKQNNNWRPEQMNSMMYESIAGMIQDSRYITSKWQREEAMQKQHLLNQSFIKQMLEEQQKQRRRQIREKQAQGWQCQVCCCEIDPSMMALLECGHVFHPECVNGYLKSQIESNNLDIKCPLEQCKKIMESHDIFRFIDGQLRQKYQKFSFNKFVEMNGATSWCPTAGCTAVFESDEALDNYRCPACRKHYCLKCRCQYHTGMTCAQYRISNSFDKNDEKFINFVKGAKFKQCPKCSYWVERNQGCSTMKCKCGQQFCYDCGGTACPHGKCNNSGRR